MIPLSVPWLKGREWEYVKECLDTNWVSYLGPFVDRFEKSLAEASGADYAVAVASGTAALHIALMMSGVGPGDEVVMPALTFVAPANAVRYCGAWPVFTDVRMRDWQWDVEQVAGFLDTGCEMKKSGLINRATGRRIAALLPVHLMGGMCDVDAVAALANRYDLPVVEDAAECLGARWKDRGIGSPTAARRRIVTTSFNGNKIITTGGGGAILTSSREVHDRARHLTTTAKTGTLEFVHDEVGYNYRLTNVAAAIGCAQLEALDEYVGVKRALADFYRERLRDTGLVLHPEPEHCRSIFWLFSALAATGSRPLIERLNQRGVMARPFWAPMHQLPMFREAMVCGSEAADRIYECGFSIPSSVGLTPADRSRVAEEVRAAAGGMAFE
ncbi:MAG: LegC family aminotransferase [Verrucomicrobia bacterium]|nr:LegC family aminotransferase [Verrucomicrobiota bacterium]